MPWRDAGLLAVSDILAAVAEKTRQCAPADGDRIEAVGVVLLVGNAIVMLLGTFPGIPR
jgi:hypothetical protein